MMMSRRSTASRRFAALAALAALAAAPCAAMSAVGRRQFVQRVAAGAAGCAGAALPCAAAPGAPSIVGEWAIAVDVADKFKANGQGTIKFQRDGEVALERSGGAKVPGGSDFTIEAKGKSRTVKWLLEYEENTLKFVGTVDDDKATGLMAGDVYELLEAGPEVRVGTFEAKQVGSVEGKGQTYFKYDTEKLKPGLDLDGRPRWQVEKEVARDEIRKKNEALKEKYGCTDQASCVAALKADTGK